jgi:putative membrane protein
MKTVIAFLLFGFVISSCNSNYRDRDKDQTMKEDNKEIAEDQNDERLEDTGIKDDAEFAVDAADGGMLEVQLANVAMRNAASSEVKEFAQMILNDHSKANDELKSIAEKKNIVLPIALSDKSQEKLEDMSEKTGAEFDKAYCNYMVKEHKEDINEFEKQAEKGNDPELKSWAAEKLQTLERHLSVAESLDESIAENR